MHFNLSTKWLHNTLMQILSSSKEKITVKPISSSSVPMFEEQKCGAKTKAEKQYEEQAR